MSTDEQAVQTEASDLLTPLLDRYSAMVDQRRALEKLLDDCVKKLAKLERQVIEQMQLDRVQSIRRDDGTFSLRKTFYCGKASSATSEEVCTVLKGIGRGYMVSEGYNAASLKSLVKELLESEEGLPPSLAACVNHGEREQCVKTKR